MISFIKNHITILVIYSCEYGWKATIEETRELAGL